MSSGLQPRAFLACLSLSGFITKDAPQLQGVRELLRIVKFPLTILPEGFFGIASMKTTPPASLLYAIFASATC